ncbi:dephospho-CoA kinase [Rhodobacter sp. SGA-6-6]|uniref:dephospho-CoA kinase n=1 Tax=Rhodobacter sp. SGA-6-6 TaxID=2710882 RepID=UPI0013E9B035|nr:dephospho-CoA kinase [Rhodobacter sp. SGA-6-6]NGM46925.1 dephospho-CoA kinase [Rhodobacter sp. SGA-6-6]
MRPFRLGLTGSIGMGKSTTAQIFAEEGVPVWDADAAVHRLYAPGGAAAPALGEALPGALDAEGGVDRAALKAMIAANPTVLDRLNAIVHPLVAADRAEFLAAATADIVLLDIPLLYESGLEKDCDAVVVVTAPPEVQRARVLSRETMTPAMFETILARQLPDAEKRARSDYVISTLTLEAARASVKDVLADIRRRIARNT